MNLHAVHPSDVSAFSALKRTVNRRLIERAVQKLRGNYAEADAIRDELIEDGWTLEDDSHGVQIHVSGTNLRWYVVTDPETLVTEVAQHESD